MRVDLWALGDYWHSSDTDAEDPDKFDSCIVVIDDVDAVEIGIQSSPETAERDVVFSVTKSSPEVGQMVQKSRRKQISQA